MYGIRRYSDLLAKNCKFCPPPLI